MVDKMPTLHDHVQRQAFIFSLISPNIGKQRNFISAGRLPPCTRLHYNNHTMSFPNVLARASHFAYAPRDNVARSQARSHNTGTAWKQASAVPLHAHYVKTQKNTYFHKCFFGVGLYQKYRAARSGIEPLFSP